MQEDDDVALRWRWIKIRKFIEIPFLYWFKWKRMKTNLQPVFMHVAEAGVCSSRGLYHLRLGTPGLSVNADYANFIMDSWQNAYSMLMTIVINREPKQRSQMFDNWSSWVSGNDLGREFGYCRGMEMKCQKHTPGEKNSTMSVSLQDEAIQGVMK